MIVGNATICVDIETLPQDATIGMDLRDPPGWMPEPFEIALFTPEDRQPPRNWKDPVKIAGWWRDERTRQQGAEAAHMTAQAEAQDAHAEAQRVKAEKWYRDASLDPHRLRVACIGYSINEGPVEVIDCVGGERAGLVAFADVVASIDPHQLRFVAHNGKRFDYPVMQLRALHHGVNALAAALHQGKPWDAKLADTKEWCPVVRDWYGRPSSSTSMDSVCALLGIGRPDNPIDGSQVLDAYVDGRWSDVIAHCHADVRDLREVYRRLAAMRGEG
jgi:DNA polymerase elongation subunit (family B)